MLRLERLGMLTVLTLAACNEAPELPAPSLTMDATTTRDLQLDVELPSDADGDPVELLISWSADGLVLGDLDNATRVPAARTRKGEVWEASVIATDGTIQTEPVVVSTTILNSLPVASVEITPRDPQAGEALTARESSVDADGDTVTYSFAWFVDGQKTGFNTQTLRPALTERGQVWELRVTPDDGEDNGEVVSAQVSIQNTAPELLSVALTPVAPKTLDAIAAAAAAEDADEDSLTYTYRWYVNDSLTAYDAAVLPTEAFVKGDRVRVQVRANDGFVDSNALDSDAVIIVNSAPTAAGVSVSPTQVREADTLICAGQGYVDADKDPEQFIMSWSVNGDVVSVEATLDGAAFSKGDAVQCTATPTDGEDQGADVMSDVLTVLNTAPIVNLVQISNASPTVADTLSAVVNATDADSDPLTYTYAWTVDGTAVGTGASLDLSAYAKGDVVNVTVTASDGTDDSLSVTSASVTVLNSAPVLSSVAIDPTPDTTTETEFTGSYSASDLDGDTLTVSTQWTLNGSTTAAATDTLDPSYTSKGDTVQFWVQVSDGTDTVGYVGSTVVLVSNSVPTGGEAVIDGVLPTDDLLCDIGTAPTDADADALSYSLSWEQDGSPWTGAVGTTTRAGDTIDATHTALGETWTCIIEVDDGDDTAEFTEDVYVADPVDLQFPSSAASVYNGSGSAPIGTGSTGLVYRAGSYVEETLAGVTLPRVSGLDLSFDMGDSTASGCTDPESRFDVLVNGTVVGEYALTHGTGGTVAFTESYTFDRVPGTGTDGDDYTIRLEATNGVCSGKGTYKWVSGGDVTLHP